MSQILVVDDDVHIRRMLQEALEMEGFTVQIAEHGGPALDIMRASRQGLVVLLGLVMPYVNGQDVLEAVAGDSALAKRHAIVMVTSSTATVGRVAELRAQLGVPLVRKPFTMEQIVNAVEQAVARLNKG